MQEHWTKTAPAAGGENAFSAQEFRTALGLFATGVTIVTARTPAGEPAGVTINSFNSVSLEPPLVLWSLARRAASLPLFEQASHYAIHVLTADQQALAERFAARGADRWTGLQTTAGLGDAPLLPGCAAVFECRQRNRHDEGDHLLFVGEVERCRVLRVPAMPLIFHGGRFYTELPL